MDNKIKIMIVDDEMIVRESFLHWFEKLGHHVETASSGVEALDKLAQTPFELLFVDIKMPGMDGIELLEKVRKTYPETMIVIITAYGSIETSIRAMKLGAVDYLLKPFNPDQLFLVMEKISAGIKLTSELNYIKGQYEKITKFDNIIGQSDSMKAVFDRITGVAKTNASVLITGETGTGKELVAKAVHAMSPRSGQPFIAINCGAMPESLLESELFGHVKGAYTGAGSGCRGLLEIVSGGTLFLDETGEISSRMQIDLLRVLEEKKLMRIGGREPIHTDFRLISATSRDLAEKIKSGSFREDFFYRINVVDIHMPPLRKREGDIPLLVSHFLKKFSQETAKKVDHITTDAIKGLNSYNWPGNVRELQNAIERAVVLSSSRTLTMDDFSFLHPKADDPALKSGSLQEMEAAHIKNVLKKQDWNISRSADILGINRATLHKKVKRFGLKRDEDSR